MKTTKVENVESVDYKVYIAVSTKPTYKMRATRFLVPQLSVAFFFEEKQSSINGLKESPALSFIDAKASPTLSVGGAMESPIKSARDVQAMYPVTAPLAFIEAEYVF